MKRRSKDEIISELKPLKYSTLDTETIDCSICLKEFVFYESGQKYATRLDVVQLACHKNHIYHYECLKEHISRDY